MSAKGQMLHRVHDVAAHVASFEQLVNPDMAMREMYVRANPSGDPDSAAADHLLLAQRKLGELIEDLRQEGYGGDEQG